MPVPLLRTSTVGHHARTLPQMPGSSRPRIGLLLVGAVATVWICGGLLLTVGCGDDCGDEGGRAAFALMTLVAPLGVLGGGLVLAHGAHVVLRLSALVAVFLA